MDKSSFDVFCPKCNMLVEAKVIARGYGGYRSDAPNPIDDLDAEYRGEYYSICLCGRCSQPFLVRESFFGIPAEFETITEEVILYPAKSSFLTEGIPGIINTSYDQAIRSFRASLYEPCALMCRKCLEAICKYFSVDGSNLNARIGKLLDAGHIDLKLLNWAHEIRLIANEAAHEMDIPVTKEDARDVLEFTEAILIYVFSLTKRFEALKMRRIKAD